ncbi:hypothetical protein VTI74DRAFT_10232 [Chaetomium olivicolor]
MSGNRNWNDRADKDLFFTILSIKNIGVISGNEWERIGIIMRSLGYGFTNEGCRQHFQGLRRAMSNSENQAANDTPQRADPSHNPITRRPGPGRGRPRKRRASGADTADGPAGAQPPASAGSPADAPPGPGGPNPFAQGSEVPAVSELPPTSVHPQFPGVMAVSGALPDPVPAVSGPTPGSLPGPVADVPAVANMSVSLGMPVVQSQPQPMTPVTTGISPQAPMTGPDDLAVDPSLEGLPEHAQQPKRQRLDGSQDPALEEEETMLSALAAHTNSATPGEYPTEYTYGDA